MAVVGIVNHKGGVGKSITTQNLASGVAQILEDEKKSENVLLIDADPQCNLTAHCEISKTDNVLTLSDYLNDENLEIVPAKVGGYNNLFLIPAGDNLDKDSINMGAMEDEETALGILKYIVDKLKGDYKYIFIDSAPGSSMLMNNVIYAADEVIIPIADKDSMEGMKKILSIINEFNLDRIVTLLSTKYDRRVGVNREIRTFLVEKWGKQLFHTIIYMNSKLNEAANNSQDIFTYFNKCNGALDYMSLAKEFLARRK